jgi:hypothetical protein
MNAAAIAILVATLGAYVSYVYALKKGIEPRQYETNLPPDVVRRLFAEKVATMGWKVVDDGNPVVAQSSLATGVRQQIALTSSRHETGTIGEARVVRWTRKWTGVPTKAHTLRMRLNSFERALRSADPSASITRTTR